MNEVTSRSAWSVEPGQWRGARSYQEDDYGHVEGEFGAEGEAPAVLMVLADGMGGEVGGANASRCVVEAFLRRIEEVEGATETRLEECLDAANRDVRAQVNADPGLEGMGSTVVAAVYDGRSVQWLSVGDSPMWLFIHGRLMRLNADHSMAPILDRMAELGELSREEALRDGRRHMLRSAVTGLEMELVDRGQRPCRLGEGDYLLLASDGLETLSEEEIERCLRAARRGVKAAAGALLSAVKAAARPHQDNVTFLLLAGEGRAGHHTGSPDQTTVKVPSRARRMARRSAVAALLLGGVLLLGIMIGRLWPGLPKSEPELGEAVPAGSPAEPISDLRPQHGTPEEEKTPVSTGTEVPTAYSDRQAPESSPTATPPPVEPSDAQTLESSVPAAEPRPEVSSGGQPPESSASVAAPPAPPDRPEPDRSTSEQSGQ